MSSKVTPCCPKRLLPCFFNACSMHVECSFPRGRSEVGASPVPMLLHRAGQGGPGQRPFPHRHRHRPSGKLVNSGPLEHLPHKHVKHVLLEHVIHVEHFASVECFHARQIPPDEAATFAKGSQCLFTQLWTASKDRQLAQVAQKRQRNSKQSKDVPRRSTVCASWSNSAKALKFGPITNSMLEVIVLQCM